MSLEADRDRARRVATTIVSVAIGIVGLTLVALSVLLLVKGGGQLLFLSIILFVLGAGLSALGFFFQLVPFRVQELAEQKRDYDRRTRGP